MFTYDDVIAGFQRMTDLAITGNRRLQGTLVDDDFNYRFIVYHERTVTERVRANGYQCDGIQFRMQDRTAAGERVGRGTGGRGNNQSVGTIGVDEVVVNPGVQFNHACDIFFMHNHVIQRSCFT